MLDQLKIIDKYISVFYPKINEITSLEIRLKEHRFMIELKGITKSYANLVVLRDVSVFIQESEIFGIIGKSGAGKS
jgi:ABC-type bacteriocin/lantibiotic exporter with double-glycine peptidase domain